MGVSEPAGGDVGLTALREELLRRDDAFERERGEKSSRAHIAADAEWEALYQSLKRAEKALAEASRVSGQCAQYIARRRRFCASRAADGCDGYCSLHAVGLGKALSRPAAGTKDQNPCVDAYGERAEAANSRQHADETRHSTRHRKKTNVHRRMKKLTNPLSMHHRTAAPCPVWSEVYDNLERPLLIDVGCAKGRFLARAATSDAARFEASLSLMNRDSDSPSLLPSSESSESSALKTPDASKKNLNLSRCHNLLGLEIYAPIVEEARKWWTDAWNERNERNERNPRNLHFVACNANVTLTRAWLGESLASRLAYVTILFPDPWSRARHAPRRVVTPAFARALAAVCREGTRVYCCSDVEPLAEEMQATFLGCPEEGAGIPRKAFELDEASYARHGEATALELKKDTRTRAEVSAQKGKGGEGPSEAFDHVFPAHPYAWQNGAQNGAKGDVHETVRRVDASDPTNAQDAFATCAGDETDSSDARDEDQTSSRVSAPAPARWLAANPMGVPTERDLVCESKWRPVYRFVVVRRPPTPH